VGTATVNVLHSIMRRLIVDLHYAVLQMRSGCVTIVALTVQVFQRRVDDETNFYRVWSNYENGFGDLDTNFWLGTSLICFIHFLTSGFFTCRMLQLNKMSVFCTSMSVLC